MKKIVFIFLLFTFVVTAQKNMPVGMHYVTVESSDANELIELEKNYFSKLHKNAIDNGEKIGWDMWRLENSTNPNHTTFLYVHLQPSLESNFGGDNKEMFPESELSMAKKRWGELVVKSKFIMTSYKGGFAPINEKPVKYVQLSYMNVNPTGHYDYEQMELKDFMPSHKSNKLLKGWSLHRINTPHAESEDDYLTANFFESMEDIYRNTDGVAQLSKQQKMNYQKILDIREMTKVEVLSLVMGVR